MVHPNEAQSLIAPRCNGSPNKWDCRSTVYLRHRRIRVHSSSLPQVSRRQDSFHQGRVALHRDPVEILGRALPRRLNKVTRTRCPNEFHKMDHLFAKASATATQKRARRLVMKIPGVRSRVDQLLILTVFLEHLERPELPIGLPAAIPVRILVLPNRRRVRCNLYWTG
jgi:hypothetical protein